MKTVSTSKAHGGVQGVYAHQSETCACEMTFAVYTPPQAAQQPCPVVWYLSGLTCSHANVMDKGEYRRAAAEHGLIIVCPDTSPRGEDVPDEADNWQFGSGAGFYLDATQEPWRKNYRMYSYLTEELPGDCGKGIRSGHETAIDLRPLNGRAWSHDDCTEECPHGFGVVRPSRRSSIQWMQIGLPVHFPAISVKTAQIGAHMTLVHWSRTGTGLICFLSTRETRTGFWTPDCGPGFLKKCARKQIFP